MVPLPKVNVSEKTENYRLVEKYCRSRYWEPEFDGLFDADVVVDFPHAPPGMLQHLCAFEFGVHRLWLRQTVRGWKLDTEPTVIPTTDPDVFWSVRMVSGRVYWAKRDCDYRNEFATLYRLKGGKIAYMKEYFNPIRFYDALGIVLPAFVYDPIESYPSSRMPEGGRSEYTLEQNVERAIANFRNPIEGAPGTESIYATDVVEVCPNAPYSMTETYEREWFDVQVEWMMRACPEWYTPPLPTFYQCTDPNVIVVESIGYGRTTWSRIDGHYTQRELQIAFLEDGKVKHFRVYFNPLNKFNSMNQSVPSFPYFNY